MNHHEEIQRYLKRYVGSRIRISHDDKILCELIMDSYNKYMIFGENILKKDEDVEIDAQDTSILIQLMLIHPQDMTRGQMQAYKSLCHNNEFKANNTNWRTDSPESILFLIENHIDAFNLIERGLAVDLHESVIKRKYQHVEVNQMDDFIIDEHPRKAVGESGIKACPVCDGVGTVADAKTDFERPCAACKGIGKVVLKSKLTV